MKQLMNIRLISAIIVALGLLIMSPHVAFAESWTASPHHGQSLGKSKLNVRANYGGVASGQRWLFAGKSVFFASVLVRKQAATFQEPSQPRIHVFDEPPDFVVRGRLETLRMCTVVAFWNGQDTVESHRVEMRHELHRRTETLHHGHCAPLW